jgi:hypothetical protein
MLGITKGIASSRRNSAASIAAASAVSQTMTQLAQLGLNGGVNPPSRETTPASSGLHDNVTHMNYLQSSSSSSSHQTRQRQGSGRKEHRHHRQQQQTDVTDVVSQSIERRKSLLPDAATSQPSQLPTVPEQAPLGQPISNDMSHLLRSILGVSNLPNQPEAPHVAPSATQNTAPTAGAHPLNENATSLLQTLTGKSTSPFNPNHVQQTTTTTTHQAPPQNDAAAKNTMVQSVQPVAMHTTAASAQLLATLQGGLPPAKPLVSASSSPLPSHPPIQPSMTPSNGTTAPPPPPYNHGQANVVPNNTGMAMPTPVSHHLFTGGSTTSTTPGLGLLSQPGNYPMYLGMGLASTQATSTLQQPFTFGANAAPTLVPSPLQNPPLPMNTGHAMGAPLSAPNNSAALLLDLLKPQGPPAS